MSQSNCEDLHFETHRPSQNPLSYSFALISNTNASQYDYLHQQIKKHPKFLQPIQKPSTKFSFSSSQIYDMADRIKSARSFSTTADSSIVEGEECFSREIDNKSDLSYSSIQQSIDNRRFSLSSLSETIACPSCETQNECFVTWCQKCSVLLSQRQEQPSATLKLEIESSPSAQQDEKCEIQSIESSDQEVDDSAEQVVCKSSRPDFIPPLNLNVLEEQSASKAFGNVEPALVDRAEALEFEYLSPKEKSHRSLSDELKEQLSIDVENLNEKPKVQIPEDDLSISNESSDEDDAQEKAIEKAIIKFREEQQKAEEKKTSKQLFVPRAPQSSPPKVREGKFCRKRNLVSASAAVNSYQPKWPNSSSIRSSQAFIRAKSANGRTWSQNKSLADPLNSMKKEEQQIASWLKLPDEIWLEIIKYLSPYSTAQLARTCNFFSNICKDHTLWTNATIKDRTVKEYWLEEIIERRVKNLKLIRCKGGSLLSGSLRKLFTGLSKHLTSLTVNKCKGDQLAGDAVIFYCSSRCINLKYLDISWCGVTDNGIEAIANSLNKLKCLCLNGCPKVTDTAIHYLLSNLQNSLKRLELSACFSLTEKSAMSISEYCPNLKYLSLTQCWKITDESVENMVVKLPQLVSVDFGGIIKLQDSTVELLCTKCENIEKIVLASCPAITDNSLVCISNLSPSISYLDVSGCKKVGNKGIFAISRRCNRLTYLDVSSTGIGNSGVCSAANYFVKTLKICKLNFCQSLTMSTFKKLISNCKSLEKLYAYGISSIRNAAELHVINPNLWIEK